MKILASLLLILGLLTGPVYADQAADQADAAAAVKWIVENAKDSEGKARFKMPAVAAPVIRYVSERTLAELQCPYTPIAECRVPYALHWHGSYVVLVRTDLPEDVKKHALIHEIVHYLQSREDANLPKNCKELLDSEYEAYRIQHIYRAKVQGYIGPYVLPALFCSEPKPEV